MMREQVLADSSFGLVFRREPLIDLIVLYVGVNVRVLYVVEA